MTLTAGFVDVHCHMLPGIDDGASSWDDSLAMAKMAAKDGIRTTICTPHQMGNFGHNHGDMIRKKTAQLQELLDEHDVPLNVMPGADVRIEPDMIAKLRSGEVLSLGDTKKYVLLELPHELYFPLEDVLDGLANVGMIGILSHPERNQGILKSPEVLAPLVERGCIMQVTAGSILGSMGQSCEEFCDWMFERDLVHIVSTDAHSPKSRRPLLRRAFERVSEIGGRDLAVELFCSNPNAVATAGDIHLRQPKQPAKSFFGGLFRRKAA